MAGYQEPAILLQKIFAVILSSVKTAIEDVLHLIAKNASSPT